MLKSGEHLHPTAYINASWTGRWSKLMGCRQAFNSNRFFIFCANVLGSPFGTTSPLSENPSTGRLYGPDFPPTTIRDDVRYEIGAHSCASTYSNVDCTNWFSTSSVSPLLLSPLADQWAGWRSWSGSCASPGSCSAQYPWRHVQSNLGGASHGER